MTVKNDLSSKMTLEGFLKYQEPELKAVLNDLEQDQLKPAAQKSAHNNPNIAHGVTIQTGASATLDARYFVFQGDKLIGRWTKDEVVSWHNAQPGRGYTRDGVPWEVSTPDTIKGALADKGFMTTAKKSHEFLKGALRPVLKELDAAAFTSTTETGQKKQVKVTPTIIAAPTHNTRGGDPEVGWALYVLTKSRSFDNRPVALNHYIHSFAQTPAQAVWNHEIGKRLLKHGILVATCGKSASAVGYKAQSKGTARLKAAGAGKSSAKAKKAAAKKTRPPKEVVDWKQAVSEFAYTVSRAITANVSGLAVAATREVRRKMAVGAVKKAVRFHRMSGSSRFTASDVRATAHALGTPHVGVKLLDATFNKVMADPTRLGLRVLKNYANGNKMFAPTEVVGREQQLGKRLKQARATMSGGGTPAAVIQGLAGKGLTASQYAAAVNIAGPGRVVFTTSQQAGALNHAAAAFRHHKKDVYVIGDKATAKALGTPNFSASGFLDSTQRTGHLRSIWLGLRSESWLTGSPLKAAEFIRAAKPRIQLKRNSMIVVCPTGMDDVKAVERLLKLAEKRNCKLVFAGPHVAKYQSLTKGRHQ